MSDPKSEFIICPCGTGEIEEDGVPRNCPVCDGNPRITLETVKEYARQVDSFSKENAELRSAYQRSREHSCRLTKRVEELERQLQSSQINYDKYDDLISIQEAQLQSARELAESWPHETEVVANPDRPFSDMRVHDGSTCRRCQLMKLLEGK